MLRRANSRSGCGNERRSRLRPRQRTRPLRWVPALLVAACSASDDGSERRADLLAPASAPTLLKESGEISVADPVFHGGFYGAEVPERGQPTRWLSDRPGQILISFTGFERRPKRLAIESRALKGATVRIRARFDGTDLGTFEPSQRWRVHAFDLPVRHCGFGQHLLELSPEVLASTAETQGRRPRSTTLRRIWLEPQATAAEEPRIDRRGLLLPPGTAASWAFWVPPGGGLVADWAGGGDLGGPTPFSVLTDDAPPRRLRRLDLAPLAGQPIRLVAAVAPSAARPLRLSRLLLTERPRPSPAVGAATARGKSLLVVGALAEGFPISPCSTVQEYALRCLLSGREAAAFGFPDTAAFDHVGHEPETVAELLESAAAPATAALVLPGEPAREQAEWFRRRVEGLYVLMADLPRAPDDVVVLAATLDPAPSPVNARDLDLTATVLAAAGVTRSDLGGLDLRAALSGRAPATLRPVAPIWLEDRSVAVTAGRRFELRVGQVRPAASVLEASAFAYLRRRRRALDWLTGDRTGLVTPGRPARNDEG